MSVTWLQRGEPTQNLCITGGLDGSIEAIANIAAVGIAVAEFDCVRTCSLVHDVMSKRGVDCVNGRNGREIWRVSGSSQNFPVGFQWAMLKKSGVI